MTVPVPNSFNEEELATHLLRAALALLGGEQTPIERRKARRLLNAALALLEV